jgi:hypothetical protein
MIWFHGHNVSNFNLSIDQTESSTQQKFWIWALWKEHESLHLGWRSHAADQFFVEDGSQPQQSRFSVEVIWGTKFHVWECKQNRKCLGTYVDSTNNYVNIINLWYRFCLLEIVISTYVINPSICSSQSLLEVPNHCQLLHYIFHPIFATWLNYI